MAFVAFNPASNSLASLVSAIFSPTAGAALVNGSISASFVIDPPGGDPSSISYYDGALSQLGIGGGLLLTNGDPTPPASNTSIGTPGSDTLPGSDTDLLNTITAAYDGFSTDPNDPDTGVGGVFDVTWLKFDVNITDPTLLGVGLDLVFGSEEFYALNHGQFPDVAGVYVNGTNYALYNGSAGEPLAVTNHNVGAGKFIDNAGSALPIEYNGVTPSLHLTAPLHLGTNTIRIAIADTGEDGVDSGLFVSNLHAVAYDAFGLGILPTVGVAGTGNVNDTSGNQLYQGNALANHVTIAGGMDVFDGAAGLDLATLPYTVAQVDLSSISFNGTMLKIFGPTGGTELVNVERVQLAGNSLFALDTNQGGTTYQVEALMQAVLDTAPSQALLSQWTANADARFALGGNLGDVAMDLLNLYVPTWTHEQVIAAAYQNIAGVAASGATIDAIAAQVTPGNTIGDLLAAGAMHPLNLAEIAGFVGTVQELDPSYF